MESIVINQKKLACEVFFAFSAFRYYNDRIIQPCIGTDEFIWQVHPVGYYESDKPNQPPSIKTIVYKIDRDNIAFRASISDMVQYLSSEWEAFLSKSESGSAMLHFTNFHTSKDIPTADEKEEGLSVYVLIDRDGFRNPVDFEIGYYDISSGMWCLKHSDDTLDLDHMKWTYLPIEKI